MQELNSRLSPALAGDNGKCFRRKTQSGSTVQGDCDLLVEYVLANFSYLASISQDGTLRGCN